MHAVLESPLKSEQPSSRNIGLHSEIRDKIEQAVLVHAGARDSYQLALGLQEAGLLHTLVTDAFWPSDLHWLNEMVASMSPSVHEMLLRRSVLGLPWRRVHMCLRDGLRSLALDKLPMIPFAWRRKSHRSADARLGKAAGKLAVITGAGLVSYSYYGFDAIREFQGSKSKRPAMLFQVHPHPATVRRILREELAAHPECSDSLLQEWELSLPEEDYLHLVAETSMAAQFLVASTFTKNSLVEHGTPSAQITVIPYGVDLERFQPNAQSKRKRSDGQLQLLFVGRINQRKGIKYLLEALRMFGPDDVRLVVCGRVVDGLELFKPFANQIEIRPSVSSADLVRAYQEADLFVFPSVAEGFGQVLLESLACGLPILSTSHTAAPDLIDEGIEGFVVEPRRSDLIAERIMWAMTHREELEAMGTQARRRAERFTWERFRHKAAGAVADYLKNEHTSSN